MGRSTESWTTERNTFIYLVYFQHRNLQAIGRFGIGRGTCCQVVRKVSSWMVKISPQFIFWPSKEEQSDIKYTFKEINKMPDVLGVIDCSHIKINRPKTGTIFVTKNTTALNYKQYATLK